jgi:hypothetical protein
MVIGSSSTKHEIQVITRMIRNGARKIFFEEKSTSKDVVEFVLE